VDESDASSTGRMRWPRALPRTKALIVNSQAQPHRHRAERGGASPRSAASGTGWYRTRSIHGLTYEARSTPLLEFPTLPKCIRAQRVLQGLRDDRLAGGVPDRPARLHARAQRRMNGNVFIPRTSSSSGRPWPPARGGGGERPLPADLRRGGEGHGRRLRGIGLGVGAPPTGAL